MSDPLPLALYQDTAFTDVIIKCKDGKEIKAHKAVLAIRSPYFKALFSGKWAETCDCILETDANSVIMQHLLKCIYTGNKTFLFFNNTYTQKLNLWELSMYYQINDLTVLMEWYCHLRTAKHVIELLQFLERFPDEKSMKKQCFSFIKNNALILGNPDIIQFAASHPNIWNKVREYLDSTASDSLTSSDED